MWGSGSKANPLGVNMGRDEIEHETHETHEEHEEHEEHEVHESS